MSEVIPPINDFLNDGQLWRIDWFGAIRANPDNGYEPLIEVIISPFTGNPRDPASINSTDHNRRKSVYVGIGLLPILRVGSIWKNRVMQPIAEYYYRKVVLQDLFMSQSDRIVSSSYMEDGLYLINPRYYKISSDDQKHINSGVNSKCLVVKYNKLGLDAVIIPMIELIRFYFASSSELSSVLFNGMFAYDTTELYHPRLSYIDKRTNCYLVMHRRFRESDAWTVARIMGSPIARKNAAMIHYSMLKNSPSAGDVYGSHKRTDNHENQGRFPAIHAPFEGTTDLEVAGKYIKSLGNKWYFLVFHILKCSAPFPFNEVYLEVESPEIEQDPLGEEEIPGWKRTIVKPAPTDKPIVANRKPSRKIPRLSIEMDLNKFSYLENKELIIVSRATIIKQKPSILIDENEIEGFSTGLSDEGDGTYTDINPLSVSSGKPEEKKKESKPRGPAMKANFDNMIEALIGLKKQGYNYKSIAVTNDAEQYKSEWLSVFPGNSFNRKYVWSYTNYRKEVRRFVLIAQVDYKGSIFYFMEGERRKHGDSYTMLMLYSGSYQTIKNEDLEEILKHCVLNDGQWFSEKHNTKRDPRLELPHLRFKKMKHTWTDSLKFVKRLIKEMAEASPRLKK